MKNDQITIFIATDKEVAKEITQKYLNEDTVPYVNIMDDVTYNQAVDKIQELEAGTRGDLTVVSREMMQDLKVQSRAGAKAREEAKMYMKRWLFSSTIMWISIAIIAFLLLSK